MLYNRYPVVNESRIKTYRWFFYISLVQILSYIIVPILIFPSRLILHIEIISCLTLGLVVALFFLLVNVGGLFIDKDRRLLYVIMIVLMCLWFLWAIITWSYIEHMDYIY